MLLWCILAILCYQDIIFYPQQKYYVKQHNFYSNYNYKTLILNYFYLFFKRSDTFKTIIYLKSKVRVKEREERRERTE